MASHLEDIMRASLRRDMEKHQRLAQQQATPRGFCLKVSGMPLRARAAMKSCKRHRDRAGTTSSQQSENAVSLDETWPARVLAALSSVLQQLERTPQQQEDAAANESMSASTASALRSVTGIELRHCGLRADNLCTKDHGATGAVSLADIVLAPQRLWNLTTQLVPPPACVSLTTLDLECNEVGDDGVQLLCSGLLLHLRGLRRLLLASNKITAAGLLFMSSASQRQGGGDLPPNLDTLGLTNNPLGAQARGTVQAHPSEDDWCDAFRTLVSHLSSLRRIHLNHAGLSTRELACVLHTVRECLAERSQPCVFDTIYLRENHLANKAEALSLLRDKVEDQSALDTFLALHVSM
ncbi:hypothetical protein LSCM1_03423 [Leishmania martiniquensis]|uniref:Uncharacterized protein n=1 Tax=Leishmania martiniquensis TaxID=1580590 RepID=A0A836KLT7_9TRYP|nr:hypothetical protein LSCM1_03423 [Leishmania martiniquensis]